MDFKRVVWHAAFYVLLKLIEEYSRTGYMADCADGVKRLLYPILLILAADFEEQ